MLYYVRIILLRVTAGHLHLCIRSPLPSSPPVLQEILPFIQLLMLLGVLSLQLPLDSVLPLSLILELLGWLFSVIRMLVPPSLVVGVALCWSHVSDITYHVDNVIYA